MAVAGSYGGWYDGSVSRSYGMPSYSSNYYPSYSGDMGYTTTEYPTSYDDYYNQYYDSRGQSSQYPYTYEQEQPRRLSRSQPRSTDKVLEALAYSKPHAPKPATPVSARGVGTLWDSYDYRHENVSDVGGAVSSSQSKRYDKRREIAEWLRELQRGGPPPYDLSDPLCPPPPPRRDLYGSSLSRQWYDGYDNNSQYSPRTYGAYDSSSYYYPTSSTQFGGITPSNVYTPQPSRYSAQPQLDTSYSYNYVASPLKSVGAFSRSRSETGIASGYGTYF